MTSATTIAVNYFVFILVEWQQSKVTFVVCFKCNETGPGGGVVWWWCCALSFEFG
jgi:hypothetical protein